MDMPPAYHEAVSTHLPRATIVYDHFHVIKLFNDKLSDLRRSLYHKAEDEQKKVLKVSRWLLLKAAENLLPERDEEARLEKALELNKPLAVAYYLKEDLRQFWTQPGKRFAGAFLTDRIRRAEASGVRMLRKRPVNRIFKASRWVGRMGAILRSSEPTPWRRLLARSTGRPFSPISGDPV